MSQNSILATSGWFWQVSIELIKPIATKSPCFASMELVTQLSQLCTWVDSMKSLEPEAIAATSKHARWESQGAAVFFDILGWCSCEDDASWNLHESMGIQRYCSKTLLRFTLRVQHEHAQVWNVPFVELILLLGPWLPFPFHVCVNWFKLCKDLQTMWVRLQEFLFVYVLVWSWTLSLHSEFRSFDNYYNMVELSGAINSLSAWACHVEFCFDFDKTLWCTRRCLSNSEFHMKIVSRTQGQSF